MKLNNINIVLKRGGSVDAFPAIDITLSCNIFKTRLLPIVKITLSLYPLLHLVC